MQLYHWYVSVISPIVQLSLLLFRLVSYFSNQIDQEREGEQIDRALLKNVLDIFVEIGMGKMDYYENDFEEAMLKDTAAYYSRKASNWILEDSCPDYMLKVMFPFKCRTTPHPPSPSQQILHVHPPIPTAKHAQNREQVQKNTSCLRDF